MRYAQPFERQFRSPAIAYSVLIGWLCVSLGACEPNQQGMEEATVETATVPAAAEDPSSHEGHMLSVEQLAVLRERIPLYREFSDEVVIENMNTMRANDSELISGKTVFGEVGILALAHGFREPGDTQFKTAFGAIAESHPTAVALGMAMMTSAHIQSAVNDLEAAGATTIVVLPMTTAENSSLTRQWHHIFGMRDEGAYLDVPRIQSSAKLIMGPTPTTSPIVATIMRDYAIAFSSDPASEVIIIVAHGPQDPEDNQKELAIIAQHAEQIRQESDFEDVRYITLQDDAPTKVRAANVEKLRSLVAEVTAEGKTAVLLTTLLTSQGGVSRRIRRDLEGLDYVFADKGLTEHPLFEEWISGTVEAELTNSGG